MEKITVWFSIQSGGDGSAYPRWFLTEEDSERDQYQMEEGWGEYCNGRVETFIGSDIHIDACENSMELNKIKMVEKIEKQYYFYCPLCDTKNILFSDKKPLQEVECQKCNKTIKLPNFYRN